MGTGKGRIVMSKIISTDEFSQVMEDCIAFEDAEFCGYNSKQCRNAIRSRDSAIIEKCRYAILSVMKEGVYNGELKAISDALDEVKKEIEGKE